MKSNRLLIGSVLFLAIGLGLIFGYCHGNAGFTAAYPIAGCSLQLCVTTNGVPAVGGLALTVIGVLLLISALVMAIMEQMESPGVPAASGERPKR